MNDIRLIRKRKSVRLPLTAKQSDALWSLLVRISNDPDSPEFYDIDSLDEIKSKLYKADPLIGGDQ